MSTPFLIWKCKFQFIFIAGNGQATSISFRKRLIKTSMVRIMSEHALAMKKKIKGKKRIAWMAVLLLTGQVLKQINITG